MTTETFLAKLPANDNLKNAFGLDAFLQTSEGQSKFNTWENAYKTFKSVKKVTPFAYIGLILITLFTRFLYGHFMLFIFLCIGIYIAYSYFRSDMNKKESAYLTARMKYAVELADKIVNVVGGYYYVFPSAQMFFYNKECCIYADARFGGLTAYNTACIKRVNIEHVHLGSTTISNSNTVGIGFNSGSIDRYSLDYSGRSTTFSNTKTTANTQTHYEWKLDILTSFLDTPHITMVFPDDKDGEDTAKKACALLS